MDFITNTLIISLRPACLAPPLLVPSPWIAYMGHLPKRPDSLFANAYNAQKVEIARLVDRKARCEVFVHNGDN